MSERVKIGVVGCGVVAAAYYLPYLMRDERAELVALCDIYPERTRHCQRLFGARETYEDYFDMLEKADIDAVFILTAPGTHVSFTLAALDAGKHILLQKPMATDMEGARQIADAVRKSGLKALIEPSSNSPLDPDVRELRQLVRAGVLGDVMWFSAGTTGPTRYDKSLDHNPYGQGAFFSKNSGGFLFDMAYGPAQIVAVLGACKSVKANIRTSSPTASIVPEAAFDRFLANAPGPEDANFWDAVYEEERSVTVENAGPDNAYSLYEMADGSIGALHVGRIFHPVLEGSGSGSLQVFGTDGNIVFGAGYQASVISRHRDKLPETDASGWYHIPVRGDLSRAKWPQPVPGGFNYYHESARELIDCIVTDRTPQPTVEWALHITEMMAGALTSAQTGETYRMTTSVDF